MLEQRQHGGLNEAFERYRRQPPEETLDGVVQAGAGLVHYFARIYSPNQRDEDLVQAGYEGLMKAIRRFDDSRGCLFSTYAGHCVMGAVRNHIRSESSYRLPGVVAKLKHRADALVEEQLKRTGEPPSLAQLAEQLNVTEQGVAEAMRAGMVSLDELDYSQIRSLKPESFRLPIEDRLALEQAFRKLTDLQRRVVYMLFFRNTTQEQAGRKLGISQRQVSRVLHTSLKEMARNLK